MKNKNQGFSWINLLVFVILGLLAARFLLAWSRGVASAKQAEAKNNIGALNRSQLAYFLDHQKFTTNLAQLRVMAQSRGGEIKTETTNYSYRIELSSQFRQFYNFQDQALPYRDYVVHIVQAKKPQLKSYIGFAYTLPGNTETSELLTVSGVCESEKPTTLPPPSLTKYQESELLGCPEGYYSLGVCGKQKTLGDLLLGLLLID